MRSGYPVVVSAFLLCGPLVANYHGPAVNSVPTVARVTLRYSPVYDEVKHRRHVPDCPSLDLVKQQFLHFLEVWTEREAGVLAQIKAAVHITFPTEPTRVYVVGCGRGISDPITIALFTKDEQIGQFRARRDEDVIADVVHELLHQVAVLPDYEILQFRLSRSYPNEPPLVRNHILVAVFETRVYGHSHVARWYEKSESGYARALALADDYGLTSAYPVRPPP